jgi:hypothetical protein
MDIQKINTDLYKNRSDILVKTVDQITKDFSTFGLEVRFSGNYAIAYEELFGHLHSHMLRLLESDVEKLHALLYHIDVDERKIRAEQSRHPGWSYSEVVTELTLYRELKKVVIREYIKENPDWLNQ